MTAPQEPRPLPRLHPDVWALLFLVLAVVPTAVFAISMPGLFRDACQLPAS